MSAPPSPLLPAPAPPPPPAPAPAAPCSCSSTPTERAGPAAPSKARVLAEALPWLARHRGRTVVIKFGGNAMVDARLKAAFAQDVLFLLHAGLKPVVVHGGGPQIGAQLDRLGLESRFEAGLRVTTDETMDVVRMVLAGQVQRELVGLLNGHGPHAVGLTGEDARLMTAVRHYAEAGGRAVDIGRVGEVARVDTGIVRTLLADGRIPVISSVARSEDAKDAAGGGVFNVNADTAAAALAAALGAETLLVLTDVEGVYADWPHGEVVPRMTAAELTALAPRLSAGMIPKMEGCLYAVNNGVRTARVIDGRVEHAVLAQVFTDGGTGTEIVPDHHPAPVPDDGPARPPGAGHEPPPDRAPRR
ncbi:acetylglutamate kinase [Streptomyces sp. bgisy095]|uniref:acetylglutamate kinase n=1 Tax=unclassified Streptomyces TaxID=2593676 RepID=UPI003D734CC8